MKFLNIGGATAVLEQDGKRMLFDPWMNDGILYGSWYHYPPLEVRIEDLGHLDYIYISHIHEDHCAPGTIRHLNRDAEIIVMDREPAIANYVTRFLKNRRFDFKKIHRIRPMTPVEIAPGLTVDMVEGDPAHEYAYLVDSGLVLNWNGFTIYNANDCAPHPAALDYIKKTYGRLNLALLPYSGGSGYPGCYDNLSHEEKLKEKKRIYEFRMKGFIETARYLDPERVMPFADQYVIAGSRSNLNQYSPHPPCPGGVLEPMRAAGLDSRLLLLNSGQSFDFATGKKSPDRPFRLHTEADRERYTRENLLEKKYTHEEFRLDDSVPIDRLAAVARARLWAAQERKGYFPEYKIYMQMPDRELTLEIDMRSEKVRSLPPSEPLREPYLRMRGTSTLFGLMMMNHISWNMADGALFVDYYRAPNVYDPVLYAFLNYLTI